MDEELTFDVDTQALDKALSALPDRIGSNIIKAALQAAGNVILESMVDLAPEQTDEPTPGGSSLPRGFLKADLHTQVIVTPSKGAQVRIGPTKIAGHVARWQNNGWMLTSHGKGKSSRKQIKQIPGKHFVEKSMDVSGERALEVLIAKLGEALGQHTAATNEEIGGPEGEYSGENY